MQSEPAPSEDPAALQVLLAAERVENERLRKIIRELQRHRFGRRAESLPVDQLLLGLEEAEQAEAANEAETEAAAPAKRSARTAERRANRKRSAEPTLRLECSEAGRRTSSSGVDRGAQAAALSPGMVR